MSKTQALLDQIASIHRMERGKITILRQGPNGPYYSHQTWEDGKNVCKYVPADKVQPLQEAIANYEHYQKLTRAYADEIIAQTRAESAPDAKKKTPAGSHAGPKRRDPGVDPALGVRPG